MVQQKVSPSLGHSSRLRQLDPAATLLTRLRAEVQSDDDEGASKFATFKPSAPIGSGSEPPQLRKEGNVSKRQS